MGQSTSVWKSGVQCEVGGSKAARPLDPNHGEKGTKGDMTRILLILV